VSAVLDDEVIADPVGVIVRLVAEVERGLAAGQIAGVVTAVAGDGLPGGGSPSR